MKRVPFRKHHLLAILSGYSETSLPIDLYLRRYFQAHKQIGSKDRKEISHLAYGVVRWKGLLDHFIEKPCSWEKRINLFEENTIESLQADDLPLHLRFSFPKQYTKWIIEEYGEDCAESFCKISNERAPITIRVNPLKITRDELYEKLSQTFPLKKCLSSDLGLSFLDHVHCFSLPEFAKGFFEMQDEGSQLIAKLVTAAPKEHIMDYCAGSGGKTLAFAHLMQGKGQLYLHDIRNRALLEAKKRLRRAGIQNVQFFNDEEARLKKHKKQMDWVLVDAPCSGSGTLRRNPDIKWRTTEETFNNLEKDQEEIFEQALKYLKPDGKIVYATCSIFSRENEEQVAKFQKKHNLKLLKTEKWLPQKNGMDGFFGAVLQKK